MPIRPENRARYPKDWKAISLRIRLRSKGRCECKGECGVDHHTEHWPHPERCDAFNGARHPVTDSLVVLTVAHLDHQPENCADENLKAMCQRCHNRYDGPMRRAGMKARARVGKAVSDLFEGGADGERQS